ncbi:MAG: hypothetical protein AAGH15_06440 [Myxococcota bacterium]
MLGRPTLVALSLVVLLAGGAAAYVAWTEAQAEERAVAAEARREARREERIQEEEDISRPLRRESAAKMPPGLERVELGMSLDELRQVRSQARPSESRSGPSERWFEEALENGARALYRITGATDRLTQVQVLSQTVAEGIAPHLVSMRERYGQPTGIWDCPAESAAGVPTRRFTWRGEEVTIQDVFLVYPGGVSITLYIAPTIAIQQSLGIGRCTPLPAGADLGAFPIATPEQLGLGGGPAAGTMAP